MTTQTQQPQSLLRWVFRQGGRTLTCGLSANDTGGYDVSVMPHWNIDASTIEAFEDAGDAFGRHAQIAMALRGSGWTVADHASHAVWHAARA